MPEAGSKAPSFKALDQSGVERTLEQYKGSWLLLYFYPKDDTPGCTAEACGLRDEFAVLRRKGCTIVGVSTDTSASHKKFAEKYALPFTLLADPDGVIIEKYRVRRWKSFVGKSFLGTVRSSFLINPEGIIAKAYPSVTVKDHPTEVVADLEALQKA